MQKERLDAGLAFSRSWILGNDPPPYSKRTKACEPFHALADWVGWVKEEVRRHGCVPLMVAPPSRMIWMIFAMIPQAEGNGKGYLRKFLACVRSM